MSESPHHKPDAAAAAEALDMRARPAPVTKLSRIMVAGVISLLLVILLTLVFISLDPPDWFRPRAVEELYAPQSKPRAEGLERLPADYDRLAKPAENRPISPWGDRANETLPKPFQELPALENAEGARLESEARKAGVFFALRGGTNPRVSAARTDGDILANRPAGAPSDGNPSLTALAPGLSGDGGVIFGDQVGKLNFLKTGPGRDVLNPHLY